HHPHILQEMRASADDEALALIAVSRPGGESFGDNARRERVELRASLFDLPLDAGARLGQCQPADARIEGIRGLPERRGGQPGGERDDAVLDVALLANKHGKRAALAETDELDLLQPLAVLVHQHYARAARQPRQHLACLAEQFLDRAPPPASGDAAFDLVPFL